MRSNGRRCWRQRSVRCGGGAAPAPGAQGHAVQVGRAGVRGGGSGAMAAVSDELRRFLVALYEEYQAHLSFEEFALGKAVWSGAGPRRWTGRARPRAHARPASPPRPRPRASASPGGRGRHRDPEPGAGRARERASALRLDALEYGRVAATTRAPVTEDMIQIATEGVP